PFGRRVEPAQRRGDDVAVNDGRAEHVAGHRKPPLRVQRAESARRPQFSAHIDVIDLLIRERLQEPPNRAMGEVAYRAAVAGQGLADLDVWRVAAYGVAHTVTKKLASRGSLRATVRDPSW